MDAKTKQRKLLELKDLECTLDSTRELFKYARTNEEARKVIVSFTRYDDAIAALRREIT